MVHGGGRHRSSGGVSMGGGGGHRHHHHHNHFHMQRHRERHFHHHRQWGTGDIVCIDNRQPLYNEPLQVETSRDTGTAGYQSGTNHVIFNKMLCPWSFFSIILLLILLGISSVEEKWTLNAGETRQVDTSVFTKQVVIEMNDPENVSVYALEKCPSLTGPTVSIQNQASLAMCSGDYEYDYFYLHEGSTIDATFQQSSGATNVYLLKGKHWISALESGTDEDEDYGGALLRRYVTAGNSNVRIKYTAKSSDVFTLLYDNMDGNCGQVTVNYQVTVTTFDLDGYSTACPQGSSSCTVNPASCLLVVAHQQQDESQDGVIDVWIESSRRWVPLLMLSMAPLALGLFLRLRKERNDSSTLMPPAKNPEAEGMAALNPSPQPTAPPEDALLPEPATTPTAPLETHLVAQEVQAETYASAPVTAIPAENVIAVPCDEPLK